MSRLISITGFYPNEAAEKSLLHIFYKKMSTAHLNTHTLSKVYVSFSVGLTFTNHTFLLFFSPIGVIPIILFQTNAVMSPTASPSPSPTADPAASLPPGSFAWVYEEPESLTAGETITVSANGLTEDCDLILALYKDNKLVRLSFKECYEAEKYINIILPDDFETGVDWSLKAFVWDSFSTMKPLQNCFKKAW